MNTTASGEQRFPSSQILYTKLVLVPLKFLFGVKVNVPSSFSSTLPSREPFIRYAVSDSLFFSLSLSISDPAAVRLAIPVILSRNATGALLQPPSYLNGADVLSSSMAMVAAPPFPPYDSISLYSPASIFLNVVLYF